MIDYSVINPKLTLHSSYHLKMLPIIYHRGLDEIEKANNIIHWDSLREVFLNIMRWCIVDFKFKKISCVFNNHAPDELAIKRSTQSSLRPPPSSHRLFFIRFYLHTYHVNNYKHLLGKNDIYLLYILIYFWFLSR